jgi:hypothetical protein
MMHLHILLALPFLASVQAFFSPVNQIDHIKIPFVL